jgi:hypothetical protein
VGKYDSYTNRIQALRAEGFTYSEICKKIDVSVPKSSLAYICRNVVLPQEYDSKVKALVSENIRVQRLKALDRNREIKDDIEQELRRHAKEYASKLDENSLKLALAMLYLGEGSKYKSFRGLMLGSSDALIIKLYIRLLKICFGIPIDHMRCRISFRADQNLDNLTVYWSSITGIPSSHFYKTIPDPRTIGKPTKKRDYKGVCVVSCAGAKIQQELQFIVEELENQLRGYSSAG